MIICFVLGLREADSTSFGRVRSTPLTLNFGSLNVNTSEAVTMPDLFGNSSHRQFHGLLADDGKSNHASPAAGSPTFLSPDISTTTVNDSIFDMNTQLSLCEKSEDLHIHDNSTFYDEHGENTVDPSLWEAVRDDVSPEDGSGRKALKVSRTDDALNSANNEEDEPKVFDAGLATSLTNGANFTFGNLGSASGTATVFTFGGNESTAVTNGGDLLSTS